MATTLPIITVTGAATAAASIGIRNRPLRYAILGTGGILTLYGLWQGARTHINTLQTTRADGRSAELRQAQLLYDALYAIGNVFGFSPYTDASAMNKVAAEITCWDEVKRMYTKLYDRNLTTDITDKLTGDEKRTFYGLLERNNKHMCSTAAVAVATPDGARVYVRPTVTAAFVRTAPRLESWWNPFDSSRILVSSFPTNEYVTMPANADLGTKVGERYDEDNDVWFSLVRYPRDNGQQLFFWVANSNITTQRPANTNRVLSRYLDIIQENQANLIR